MTLLTEPAPQPVRIVVSQAEPDTRDAYRADCTQRIAPEWASSFVSGEAANMQNSGFLLLLDVHYYLRGCGLFRGSFPDISNFIEATGESAQYSVVSQQAHEQFRILESRLHTALESEPFEDGFDHPIDDIIREALNGPHPQETLLVFRSYSLDAYRPAFAAAILQSIGRQDLPGDIAWRTSLVENALMAEEFQIREAALDAADAWGEIELVNVLESHDEPVHWLRVRFHKAINTLRQ